MISLAGFVIVIVSVIAGYVLHHGNLLILYQPTELLIIGGAAVGALVASSSPNLLKHLVVEIKEAFLGNGISREKYLQLLMCLNELFRVAAQNPLAIEKHSEDPANSEIFKKYPLITRDHHAMSFLCNTLSLLVSGSISPYDLDDLLDQDIEAMHKEERSIPATLNRLADALPGLGIVAAVLGVVITMGKLSQGKEVIGQSVAAALVGTFLGILLCYGIFQPLAAKVESSLGEKAEFFLVMKAGLIAQCKGCRPAIALEYTRRNIPPALRPSFKELEAAISPGGASAASDKKAA
jgi:chemotaxis protein MotA